VTSGELLSRLALALNSETPCALATVITGPGRRGAKLLVFSADERVGSLGHEGLDHAVATDAAGSLAHGETEVRHYGPQGERRMDDVEVFIQAFAPPPRFYIFGAIDFAAALCKAAKLLGYRVTVVDARATFATERRFPDADEVVVAWPPDWLAEAPVDEATAVAILTHDPKFDDPLIKVALSTPAGYIGAMGSRKTNDERRERLLADGVTAEELGRVSAPIGLDLGSRTPPETAVSILAEIIATRSGHSGTRLTTSSGQIHH
jgi:xanthine dehydrogenase accessory factor